MKKREEIDPWESKKITTFHFGTMAFNDLHTAEDCHKFYRKVDDFIGKHGGDMSVDLLAAFTLWCKLRTSKCVTTTHEQG